MNSTIRSGWCNHSGEWWQLPPYLEPVVSVEGHVAYVSVTVLMCTVVMVVNVLVLGVYHKSHQLHAQYGNEYLINLAAADLASGVGFLTVTAASNAVFRLHSQCWEGGPAACYVATVGFEFPCQASLLALSAVAAVTMIRVYRPLTAPLIITPLRRCLLLATPWLLAAAITTVVVAATDCSHGLLHVELGRVARYLQQGVFMAVMVLMVTINIALLLKASQVRRATALRQGLGEVGESCGGQSLNREASLHSSEIADVNETNKCTTTTNSNRRAAASASFWLHKSVYITTSIIATFLVCNLPFLVASTVFMVDDIRQVAASGAPHEVDGHTSVIVTTLVTRFLSLVNAVANFFLYTLRNEVFRAELCKLLKFCHKPPALSRCKRI